MRSFRCIPFVLFPILCALHATCQDGNPYGFYPNETTVPEAFVLRNETAASIADRVATLPGRSRSKRTVIFTTMRFGSVSDDLIGMVSTFCYHLHGHGLLRHALLITTDEATWKTLRSRGFPAYLDRAFPRPYEFVNQIKDPNIPSREFDISKHWWAWRFLSEGYRVVYLDSDAAVLGDVLEPFDHPFKYDVQGLTDWQDLDHPELDLAYTLPNPCRLYRIRSDPEKPEWHGHWTQSWDISQNDFLSVPLAPNPCQSTGVWYLEPTTPALAFIRALSDRVIFHQQFEWEQTAWNDVLLHFLWGAGDHEPVKYRALPLSKFVNLEGYRARRKKGMPLDLIILHLGGIRGADKRKSFEEEGIWQGNFSISDASMYSKFPSTAGSVNSLFAGRDQMGWGATRWVGLGILLFAVAMYVGISYNKDLKPFGFTPRLSIPV